MQLSIWAHQNFNRKVATSLTHMNDKINELASVEIITNHLVDKILAYTRLLLISEVDHLLHEASLLLPRAWPTINVGEQNQVTIC